MNGSFNFLNEKAPAIAGALLGGERGIWTLATLSRPTPLAGEPLHHLGISPNLLNCVRQRVGGESGIRTHGCLHIAGFQDRCLKPLDHLSSTMPQYNITIFRACQWLYPVGFWNPVSHRSLLKKLIRFQKYIRYLYLLLNIGGVIVKPEKITGAHIPQSHPDHDHYDRKPSLKAFLFYGKIK